MPGDFEHLVVGPTLSRVEWELATAHHLASQAVGDIIYASSAAQLEGLGIGPNGDLLIVSGGIPSWAHILQVETNGLTIGLVAGAPEPDNNAVHIWKGSAGAIDAEADAALIIEHSAGVSINILSPANTTSRIAFGNQNDADIGEFRYNHNTNAFEFDIAAGAVNLLYSVGDFAFQEPTVISAIGDLTLDPTGDILVTAGKTIVGHSVDFEHHTADDTLTLAESNSMHSNFGEDGAMTLTLPASAGIGTLFRFVVMAAQELRVEVSAAGQIIYANGVANTDDGGADLYIGANAPGENMTLVADGNDDWVVVQLSGTWTVTQP